MLLFVLAQPFAGGGFLLVAAVLQIAHGAALGGTAAVFFKLAFTETVAVGGGGLGVLLRLRPRHCPGNQRGGVERGGCGSGTACGGRGGGRFGLPFFGDGGAALGLAAFAFGGFLLFAPLLRLIAAVGVGGSLKTFAAVGSAVCGSLKTRRLGKIVKQMRARQDVVRHRQHMDAVHGAGRDAQAAAGAFVGQYGVHQLGSAHNRIDGAGADAGGAADADVFVDPRQRGGLDFRRRLLGHAQRLRQIAHHPHPARRAQVDCRFARCHRFGIRQAA